MRLAGPWPSATSTDAALGGQPGLHVGDRVLDVAAIGLDGLIGTPRRLDRAGLDVHVGRDHLAQHVAQRLPLLEGVEAERRQAPPRLALGEAERAYVGQRVVRRGAEVDRRLAAAGRRRPRRLQELLAGARPGRAPGSGSRSGSQDAARGVSAGSRSMSISMSSTSTGASDSMPSTACPSASWSSISRRLPGATRPSCRARSRTSSVSSSSRHGGAHSRVFGSERSAGPRRRTSGSPRPSSPQNSTRSGCSSVGGNTSTMPPRTANSPRFSTRSTRA